MGPRASVTILTEHTSSQSPDHPCPQTPSLASQGTKEGRRGEGCQVEVATPPPIILPLPPHSSSYRDPRLGTASSKDRVAAFLLILSGTQKPELMEGPVSAAARLAIGRAAGQHWRDLASSVTGPGNEAFLSQVP